MNTVEVGVMTEAEETPLGERDERVEVAIRRTLKRWRNMADDCDHEARELRNDARRVEAAVKAERWWELKDILDEETIESLCNISPKGLLDNPEE